MKNYPLLSLNNQKQWLAWNKTYLTEINHNIEALWDYNNYFIPDYCEKELNISSAQTIDATELDYNEFFRAVDVTEIMLGSTPTNIKLGAGFLLVSKARNEGSIKYTNNLDNYFIQPYGYGSFYVFTYNNYGEIVGIYDRYAEETYGLDYMVSFFNHYPRFLSTTDQWYSGKTWVLVSYIKSREQPKAICTKAGTVWADIINIKPMFFHFVTADGTDFNNDYGEEVIVDTVSFNSINIDKVSIAQYNEIVLEEDNDNIWPNNIVARVI